MTRIRYLLFLVILAGGGLVGLAEDSHPGLPPGCC